MAKKAKQQSRQRPDMRKFKKKTSPLTIDKVEYVDYKDVDLLSRFMSDRAKIRNQKVSGNSRQQQLEVAKAIKNAREMALLPYTTRVASAPRGGRRDDRRNRDQGNDVENTDVETNGENGLDVDVKVDAVVDADGQVAVAETFEFEPEGE